MSARKARPAVIEFTVYDRADKLPKVGDTLQLGRQSFSVASIRLHVELKPVAADDEPDDE